MTVFDSETSAADPFGEFDLDESPLVSLEAPRKRSYARVMAGVGFVALAAMIGAYAFVAATPETTRVMVASGELEVGEPITVGDLRVVEVGSVSGLDVISPDDQGQLIGLTPRSPIPDGAVLNLGFFVAVDDAIPSGKVIVGAVLVPGSAPTSRLRIGDSVGLIEVVSGARANDSEPTLLGEGEVWAIGPASDRNGAGSDELWVSVLVDIGIQEQVAQAASADELWVTAVRSGS